MAYPSINKFYGRVTMWVLLLNLCTFI